MSRIVITDLTPFTNGRVCIAGIDEDTGACIRPIPYLTEEYCRAQGILPGSILRATFTRPPNLIRPHTEDRMHTGVEVDGQCSSDEFLTFLEQDTSPSVGAGFAIQIVEKQKSVPAGAAPNRSIITLEIDPSGFRIAEDDYNPGKIRALFTDSSGRFFSYLPIRDLGFFNFALEHHSRNELRTLNSFIHQQARLFLRLGLGREHEDAYWMQVNGIYTFPDYPKHLRNHG